MPGRHPVFFFSAEDVPELAVEYDMLAKLKERVTLARTIDNAQHNVKKENHEMKWLRETAEALEIDVGSDFEDESSTQRCIFSLQKAVDYPC